MSQHHKYIHHRHRLQDMQNITSAMKNLALMETRKLAQQLENQQQLLTEIEQVAADFLNFFPYCSVNNSHELSIWVILGSERGFCGDFNETLVELLSEKISTSDYGLHRVIGVGSKLQSVLDQRIDAATYLPGAVVTEELAGVLQRLIKTIDELQQSVVQANAAITLTALYHDMQTLSCHKLMPPFRQHCSTQQQYHTPPLITLDPKLLFGELVQHYLFHHLQQIATTSLMAENHRRIQHMEGATRHLAKSSQQLTQRYKQLRQEEITEEIEVILLNALGTESP